jgi:hypothetical protein
MIMLQGCGGKMAVTSKKSKCKNFFLQHLNHLKQNQFDDNDYINISLEF